MLEFVSGSVKGHSIGVNLGIELPRIAMTLINCGCNDRRAKAVTDAPHRYFPFKRVVKFISWQSCRHRDDAAFALARITGERIGESQPLCFDSAQLVPCQDLDSDIQQSLFNVARSRVYSVQLATHIPGVASVTR